MAPVYPQAQISEWRNAMLNPHTQMILFNASLFMGCVLLTIFVFALIEYVHDVWIEHQWRRAKRRVMDALLRWSRH